MGHTSPPPIHIGHEIVNMLLGLITEMETFDQSLKGGKGENYSKYCLRESKGDHETWCSRRNVQSEKNIRWKEHFRSLRYCQLYNGIREFGTEE